MESAASSRHAEKAPFLHHEKQETVPNKWIELLKLVFVVLLGAVLFYQIFLLAMKLAELLQSSQILRKLYKNARTQEELWMQFFPKSIQDVERLSKLLLEVQTEFPWYVFGLVAGFYAWKQTFAIPGSALLNVLAGVLYGPIYGTLLVCFLTAFGSSTCYLLSKFLGGGFLVHFVIGKGRIQKLSNAVQTHSDNLLFYCLFIRLFPFTPNWLINIASPWLNIPLHTFFVSVLLGSIPYNMTCTQAGSIISSIQSMSDILTPAIMLRLLGIALMALLPAILRERYFKKLKEEELSHLQ